LEQLETRLTPATLVDPFTVTYQDLDGDQVQVRISKPLLVDMATADQVCKFNVGSVDGSSAVRQHLQELDITPLNQNFMDVSVTVLRRGGNGHADVGYLNATERDLNVVRIDGDLGRITAGDPFVFGSSAFDVDTLRVHSLGKGGASVQALGPESLSRIDGSLRLLEVATDVVDADFQVSGVLQQADIGGDVVRSRLDAVLFGRIQIDGSLLGDPDAPTTISGRGGVREAVRTVRVPVFEQAVFKVNLPLRLLNKYGVEATSSSDPAAAVNITLSLTEKQFERLLAQLRRGPPGGPFVEVAVIRTVTKFVEQQFRVLEHANAIDELLVGGDVVHANILGEFGSDLGRIEIQGDVRASNISAGVDAGTDGVFGTMGDRAPDRGGVLAELIIRGRVEGTANGGDQFGIVAAEIRSAVIGRKPLALHTGPSNDDLAIGSTGDVRLREPQGGGGAPPAP
jgi:hypothetical protein